MKQAHAPQVSFFPTPLQDELLDSFVYRYHHLSGYSGPGSTLSMLFGEAFYRCARMLTTRINYLYSRLPSTLFRDVDDLLDKHSLLPAISRVCDGQRMGELRVTYYYGGAAPTMPTEYRNCRHANAIGNSLHCCPLCVKSDSENIGIAYWRRSHQLNGVVVCHLHGCDLIDACPYCGRELRDPEAMNLPASECRFCKKKFLPTFSHPGAVRELAKLAHNAVNSPAVCTDLAKLQKTLVSGGDYDTHAFWETAKRRYGEGYLAAIKTLRLANQPDWLADSFGPLTDGKTSGGWRTNLSTFAVVLMAVHIIFRSWKNLDQAMHLYSKAA